MPVVSNTNTVNLGDATRLTRADVPDYDDVLTATGAAETYVAQASPVAYVQRATLDFEDTTAKDLFTLPAGAQIIGFLVNVTTAFDDSGGSDLLDLGTAETADQFVADFDCGSTGLTLQASADEDALSAATVVQGVYTPGTGAAAGAATISCLYLVPSA